MMKGRFAPTPSGRMHLGNAFSALLAWLSAKSQGGHMVLRVEDLDPARTSAAFMAEIRADLLWMGLTWEEGPDAGGPNEPYLQSQRGAFYEECLEKLQKKGLLYPCFCSRAELHAAQAPHASDGTYIYSGRCRNISREAAARRGKQRPPAVRVRVPDETVALVDGCQGPFCQNLQRECGDFILRRSDGVFAYQLAAPADDGAMGITEVVRGRDLLASAPRQIWLMKALGFAPPRYCHTPLLLAPGGRRLAKRDADLDLGALRAKGLRPETLVGVLAAMAGLLPKARPVKAVELLPLFAWDKIRKEDIVVDSETLDSLF